MNRHYYCKYQNLPSEKNECLSFYFDYKITPLKEIKCIGNFAQS